MIAQMHLTLLQLEDNPQVFANIGPFDEFYAVDGFNEARPSPVIAKHPMGSNQKRNIASASNQENKKKASGSAMKQRSYAP